MGELDTRIRAKRMALVWLALAVALFLSAAVYLILSGRPGEQVGGAVIALFLVIAVAYRWRTRRRAVDRRRVLPHPFQPSRRGATTGIASSAAADEASAQAPASMPRDGRMKVLIVDDEPIDLLLLRMILERDGYAVRECSSGEDAVRMCRHERPDILMLDGLMPGMDGITTCRAVLGLPGLERLPVIMVSGMQDERWIEEAYAAGAINVVDKAVNQDTYANNIRRALAGLSARQPARG